jgi:hypothetical protein
LWWAESANTAVFSYNQRWTVSSFGWSIICEANFTYGTWGCANWVYGDYTYNYTLPYSAWKGFYLWDYNRGGWSENVVVNDTQY